ncbi:hypothetical protein [Alteromonas gracilis]|uniref:hypothetical protein n=1 Tax=Alteromonas gracilis TaxID=1479524 RepID=UPI0037352744
MITIERQDGSYTFNVKVNAKGIILYLAYYKSDNGSYAHTDAWPKLRRNEIDVPQDVILEAKSEALNLMTVE